MKLQITLRSNFFKIKDRKKFHKFIQKNNIVKLEDSHGKVGFFMNIDESVDLEEYSGKGFLEAKVLEKIYPVLKKGEICMISEIAFNRKKKIIFWSAGTIDSSGKKLTTDIHTFYKTAGDKLKKK